MASCSTQQESKTAGTNVTEIPKEFRQITRDFLRDFFTTFPEYRDKVEGYVVDVAEKEDAPLEQLFAHIKSVFPERFFDILYKNNEMFADPNKNTEFLPGVNFDDIWRMDDVSDATRETLWKYLQLIMFSILETIQSQESFGDTAKLFEAINEDELKNKIQETVEQMKGLFENIQEDQQEGGGEGINLDDLPNPDSVHEHLNGLLDGKLGKLAAEIAEETAKDFEMDLNEDGDVGDMFKKLFKNPGKLMGLVNNISSKLDAKMKSGDIKESDLMKEAGDLMSKMKNMPGMPNIEELMKNMNLPKNKQGIMKQQFNQNMRASGTKARLQKKLEEKRKAQEEAAALQQLMAAQAQQVQAQQVQAQQVQAQHTQPSMTDNMQFDGKSFSDGSKVKRSKAKKGKKK